MAYLKFAIWEALSRTGERLAEGVWPAVIAFAIFSVTALLAHKIRGKEELKEWLWDGVLGLLATIIVGSVVFLVYFSVIDPARDYRALEKDKQALVDAAAKKRIEDTELKAAQDRATQLSDTLAMRKGGEQSDAFKKLQSDFALLKAHALTDAYVDPSEWPALTDDQITSLVSAWTPLQIHTIRLAITPDSEPTDFYKSLKQLAVKLNCKTELAEGAPDNFMGINGMGIFTFKNNALASAI